jgi:hypothetical protein
MLANRIKAGALTQPRALHVSLDALVFDEGERGPNQEMRLQFEAVSQLPD